MGEAANEQLGYRKKALRWLRKRGDIIGIAGVVAGVAIGVGVPVWQNNFVEVPELSIEINGISRKISADAALPSDDEVLSVLFRGSGRFQSLFGESGTVRILSEYLENEGSMVRRSLGRNRKGYKPEVVQVALEQAKEELKGLPDRIDSRQQEQAKVDILTFETITHADVRRLNRPISPEVNVTQVMFERNASDRQNNQSYFNRIIGEFKSKYAKRVDELQVRYTELQTQLPTIERRIEALNEDLLKKRSFFTISAILTNSGRASTSIRQPAMVRIYIGTGNYVDLKLLLQEYKESAEISSHGMQIATFRSDEISTLPESDQNLINTYWGQSVHAILFVEDILGNIHNSNRIAFSEGLYQKIIYDRLSNEASSKGFF